MGRTLDEVIRSLPPGEQARIETSYQQLRQQVQSLQRLGQLAGKAQADVAAALRIKQPSVSRIEKQTDMYLSTLRGYVEAPGGELELVVRFPHQSPLRLRSLTDMVCKLPG